MKKPEFIDMKGFLSFHIMWLLGKRKLCSSEIIDELGKKRHDEPSPGTLYPALNALKKDGLVQSERDDKKVVYSITPKGKADLEIAITYFKNVYSEIITGQAIGFAPKFKEIREVKEEKEEKKDEMDIGYI